MYETFYNLSTNPFRLTPDPRFCFAHASHKQARAYLEYALKLGEGFIMVTGRPGTGKTTLIEAFVKELEISHVVAERIAASNLEAAELLRAVAYAYGIDAEGIDKATLRRRIQQFFTQQVQSGRRVLLIIDEAQGLPHAALEELRLLADLQAGSRPLLQLFLVGQDALRDLMCAPAMEQFQQRVIGTCHLEPLDLRDTRGYVQHRLHQAGWQGDPELTGEAIVSIFQHSQGVPRHINKTCTRLLLHGLLEGKHRLDRSDVLTVVRELREEQLGPLELNQLDVPGVAEPVTVPELQNGSVSMTELALLADSAEVKRSTESARSAARIERRPAAHQTATRPAAGHARSAAQPRRARRPVKTRAVRGSRVVALGRALRPYGTAMARQLAVCRSELVALGRALRPYAAKAARKLAAGWSDLMVLGRALWQYGIATARKLDGRLQWQGGLTATLGALAVVTLSVAALTTHSEDDASDQGALLAVHSELTEPLPAQPDQTENSDAVDPQSTRKEQAPQSSEPTRAAEEKRPAPETLAVAAAVANRASAVPAQPLSESAVANTSAAKPVVPVTEPPQVAEAKVMAKAPDVARDGDGQQTAVVDSEALGVLPATQDETPSQGAMALDAHAPAHDTVAETEDPVSLPEVTELAALVPAAPVPVIPQQPSQPAAAADDVIPPAFSMEQKIDELLALGRQALSEDRLLIPADNNAHRYYRQVLILDPDNPDASDGIEQIVRRYTLFAERALEREDEEKTRQYIARGLTVSPRDTQLLALQDRMITWLARLELEAMRMPVAPAPAPAAPATKSPPPPQDFMSRLKTFFSSGQRRSRGNEMWEE